MSSSKTNNRKKSNSNIVNKKKNNTKKTSKASASRNKSASKPSSKTNKKSKIIEIENTNTNTNINEKLHEELSGVIVFLFGILTFLGLYFTNSVGLFGEISQNLFMGIAGKPAYAFPFLILAYGLIKIIAPNNTDIKRKILLTTILLCILSAIIQIGSYKKECFVNANFGSYLRFFYENKEGTGGGIIGGVIGIPLLTIFQQVGSLIVLITLGIVVIMFITDVSFKEIINEIGKKYIDKSKNKKVVEEIEQKPDIKVAIAPNQEEDDFIEIPERSNKKVLDLNNDTFLDMQNETVQGDEIKEEPEIKQHIPAKPKKNKKEPVETLNIDVKPANQHEVYEYPPFNLLKEGKSKNKNYRQIKMQAVESAKKLENTLKSFNIEAKVINVSVGPAITRYELQPGLGVKVSRIVNLTDDIALNLAASGVRIEAPIPGKAAVGIEVPNKEVAAIALRDVLETPEFVKFKSRLAVALGKDVSGENKIIDIAKMPHLLIAGATGSGKSVCINSLIISLLYKATPDEVKLLLIDPKVVELGVYNGIPHLLIPVVTDPQKAAGALNWAVQEMVSRYKSFADKGVRDIDGYNALIKETEEGTLLPQIVIIIDELADLMMVAPNDVEDAVCRLAQMARAAGMHLVIATQRPSVNVITGVIKANIPSRISFAVTSQVDSRTILDMSGAEKLMGKGDMLYYPVGIPKPVRVKGAFISEKEVERIIEFIKSKAEVSYDEDIIEEITEIKTPTEKKNEAKDKDELLTDAIELVVEVGQASVSMIQRRFKVGYARAGRIVDQMTERGIISGFEGSKPRRVLISKLQWEEMKMGNSQNG